MIKLMFFFVFLAFMYFLVYLRLIHRMSVDKKNKKPLKSTLSCKIAIFYPLYSQLVLIKGIKSIFFLHIFPIIP